jgi:hypothetical protein
MPITQRTDYYTAYSALELIIVNNVGLLPTTGLITGVSTDVRNLIQTCFNQATFYVNGLQRNLSDRIASFTLTTLLDWDLDFILDMDFQYIEDVQSIYIYNNSTSSYEPILKYKTPSSFISQCLPTVMTSSGLPTTYTIVEGKYLWLYPRPDLLYTLKIRYKRLPVKIASYSGNSNFENDFDHILTTLSTAFFWLAKEENELAAIWLNMGNAMLKKRLASISLPSPLSAGNTVNKQNKPYADPFIEADE